MLTSGKCCLKRTSSRGRSYSAMVMLAPSISVPAMSSVSSLSAPSISAYRTRMRFAYSSTRRPAAVSSIWLCSRSKSLVLKCSSSWRI